MIAHGHLAP
jgi:hypothetical protein